MPLEISSQKTLVSGKAGRQNQILKIEAADDPVSDVKRELSGNPHQKQWGLLRNHHNKGSLKGGISMAEINDGKGIKVIAYYLPQFHTIPENDRFWGKGFTEWTNTKKAKPLFPNHYQPKIPLNQNYYNLMDDKVKIWQSDLAQRHGVFGFCYYHYWFQNGKKLLEKPAEQMLANPEVTIPFCFSWANENWTKNWDGGNQELIVAQDYGGKKEWKSHLEYLLPFFRDKRYITLDGKPVFLIYKPEQIPQVDQMLEYWETEMQKQGFPGICFMIQNPNWYFSPSYQMGCFSYQIKFHPFFAMAYTEEKRKKLRRLQAAYRGLKPIHCQWMVERLFEAVKHKRQPAEKKQARLDYDRMWERIIRSKPSPKLIEGAFVDWDNTARTKTGLVHLGATPEKFYCYLSQLKEKVLRSGQQPVIFLNAWNEWAEGAYLEPDEKHGYAYLEQLSRVFPPEEG